MNKYYKTNAVYAELGKNNYQDFLWPKGNSWFLVYADNQANPKAIVYALGRSATTDKLHVIKAIKAIEHISRESKIPLFKIIFNDGDDVNINSVYVEGPNDSGGAEVELSVLKEMFSEVGIPVKSGRCEKAINSAASSAYHLWQRDQLGSIVVSDIDLLRIDINSGLPTEILELKRSFYDLSDWQPYPNDYPNFDVLVKISKPARMNFAILYNKRSKNPWCDDPSQVRIFNYDINTTPQALGIMSFDEFINGNYGKT